MYRVPQMNRPRSSGSSDFDALREAIAADPQLKYEIEALFRLVVETYNPSDRGVRFVTGGISEWILAMSAYAAGILTLPEGHNADGNDLRGVLDQSKALWSAKGSNARGGTFTITNGQGGSGGGLTVATIFWSPELPGLVFADPHFHPEIVRAQVERKDAMLLPKKAVAEHAVAHPECVVPLTIPENPGTATRDPSFEAVKLLVEGGAFPRLRRLLDDAVKSDATVVGQLKALKAMRDAGDLTPEQYQGAVKQVTGI